MSFHRFAEKLTEKLNRSPATKPGAVTHVDTPAPPPAPYAPARLRAFGAAPA